MYRSLMHQLYLIHYFPVIVPFVFACAEVRKIEEHIEMDPELPNQMIGHLIEVQVPVPTPTFTMGAKSPIPAKNNIKSPRTRAVMIHFL